MLDEGKISWAPSIRHTVGETTFPNGLPHKEAQQLFPLMKSLASTITMDLLQKDSFESLHVLLHPIPLSPQIHTGTQPQPLRMCMCETTAQT